MYKLDNLQISEIMTPLRKSIPNILKRALKKCEQYFRDGIVVYCTPTEFLSLCWYFDTKPRDMWYYEEQVSKGICNSAWHYLHVKKWDCEFPVNRSASLSCKMDLEYY